MSIYKRIEDLEKKSAPPKYGVFKFDAEPGTPEYRAIEAEAEKWARENPSGVLIKVSYSDAYFGNN